MKKILLIILIFINSVLGLGISGKVIEIPDGDTFYLKTDSKIYKIRMYGIDAPELSQKYGIQSKKYLEKLIFNKYVRIKVKAEDKYGRKVGQVFYKNKDINLEMIRSGNAWFYEYHAKKEKAYKRAFEFAKKKRFGLWQDKNVENPRNYRLKHRRGN